MSNIGVIMIAQKSLWDKIKLSFKIVKFSYNIQIIILIELFMELLRFQEGFKVVTDPKQKVIY